MMRLQLQSLVVAFAAVQSKAHYVLTTSLVLIMHLSIANLNLGFHLDLHSKAVLS